MYSSLLLIATLALLPQVGAAVLAAPVPALARSSPPSAGVATRATASPSAAALAGVEYIYRVEFTDDDVEISARFPVRKSKDFAFVGTFSGRAVTHLVVRDSSGERPVSVTDDPGVYRVDGLHAGTVEATYRLALTESCGRGSCRTADGAVVLGGDAILFPLGVDAAIDSSAHLDFLLPQVWSLVSGGGTLGAKVSAPTLARLGNSAYLAGDQITARLPSGELVVVQTSGWQIGAEAVAGLIGAALGEQERLLGRLTVAETRPLIHVTPHAARHSGALVAAAPGLFHLTLDGRSRRDAMAHQLVGPLTALFARRLAAGLAGADGPSMQWWRLGFTRYTATLAAVRAGNISEERFIGELMEAWRLTSNETPPGGRISLAKAGSRDDENTQRLLSAGGFLTCFLLDTRMRAATGGAASLATLMARTQGRTVDNAFLHDEIARLAGRDAARLFRVCVLEENPPPLAEEASHAGLELVDAGTGEPLAGFSLVDDEPVIRRVFAAGPARAMGLRAGDRITAVDGEPVGNVAQIQTRLAAHAPGDALGISVRTDDGQIYSAVLKLWERTETVLRRAEHPTPAALNAWTDLVQGEGTTFTN